MPLNDIEISIKSLIIELPFQSIRDVHMNLFPFK